MLKRFLWVIPVFIPALLFAGTQYISLDNAISIALSKNQDIRQYEQDVETAKAKYQQAVASMYYPDINAGFTFTYLDPNTVDAGNSIMNLGAIAITNNSVFADNYSATLKLAKPIFLGFTLANSLRLQELNLELVGKKYADKKNEIIYLVKKDFFNLFLLKENIKLSDEMNRQLSNTLKFTKANYNAGLVSKYDLIRMEVQYQNNQPRLLKLKNAYAIAIMGFYERLGLPHDTQAEFIGALWDITNTAIPGLSVVQSAALAKSNDINLIGMKFSVETMKISKAIASAGYYPSLNGFFNFGLDYKKNSDAADPERVFKTSWSLGLALTIPIDDWIPGSKTEAAMAELDASIRKMDIVIGQYENTIDLQVKTLYMQIDEAKSILGGVRATVDQAKLGLKLANEKFYAGTISSLELSDAEIAYTQALANYLQSVYDYAAAVLKLRRMTGYDSAAVYETQKQ
ncbi:MAG: hypothetical protein A2Y33_00875 [Spirochaetes bacterium GWF1_51_8]|nr:MAG: hypothetical protein A2Y33_00875 [Spirochaetes bacterium GWF1_51_8]